MIRLFIEAGLIFLAPFLLYTGLGLVRVRARRVKGARPPSLWSEIKAALEGAPYVLLFVTGAVLVLMSLLAAGTPSGGKPEQHYEPARIEDGKVKPGHFE